MTALPIHPFTGLTAIGWRKPRPSCGETEWQPIWPIRGGADDPPKDDPAQDDPKKGDDPPSDLPTPKPGDRTARSEDDKTDWVAEAKKWEKNAKQHAKQLEDQAAQLKELEPLQKIAKALAGADDDGKGKGGVDQLTERFDQLQTEVDKERMGRLRAEVAHEKGLTPGQAARLAGSTKEELEADADQMIEDFGISKDDGDGKTGGLVVKRSGSGDGGGGASGSVAAGRDMYKPRAKNKQ